MLEELLVLGVLLTELEGGKSGEGVPKGIVALRSEQKEVISGLMAIRNHLRPCDVG